MSKITLEPNDSGAGTFSIVSPDSNINRTLNLPDEAGKLLSTGNDDPAEIFKQSNILGTVSESGGVPTGAIIERGSNSNGEFVRYADGTQIATRVIVDGRMPVDSVSFFSVTYNFPVSFASNPSVSVNGRVSTTGGSVRLGHALISSRSTSNASVNYESFPGASNLNELRHITLIAIGRWF